MRNNLKKSNFKREISFAFYEHLRETNPELFKSILKFNIGQYENIIATPFRMVKELMKEGTFENVRIRYLGIFVVKERRVESLANRLVSRLDKGEIDKKLFKYYMGKIIKYTMKFPNKFSKEEVDKWMSLY